MLYGGLGSGGSGGAQRCICSASLLWTSHSFCYQHIIKAHQLGIRRVFVVAISYVDHCLLFDLAEHREKSWFHSVAVQCVLPGLVQRLVCHGHNLVKYGVDIRMLPLLLAFIPLGGSRAGCQALLPSHASHAIVLLRVEHHPPLLLTSPGPSWPPVNPLSARQTSQRLWFLVCLAS